MPVVPSLAWLQICTTFGFFLLGDRPHPSPSKSHLSFGANCSQQLHESFPRFVFSPTSVTFVVPWPPVLLCSPPGLRPIMILLTKVLEWTHSAYFHLLQPVLSCNPENLGLLATTTFTDDFIWSKCLSWFLYFYLSWQVAGLNNVSSFLIECSSFQHGCSLSSRHPL